MLIFIECNINREVVLITTALQSIYRSTVHGQQAINYALPAFLNLTIENALVGIEKLCVKRFHKENGEDAVKPSFTELFKYFGLPEFDQSKVFTVKDADKGNGMSYTVDREAEIHFVNLFLKVTFLYILSRSLHLSFVFCVF